MEWTHKTLGTLTSVYDKVNTRRTMFGACLAAILFFSSAAQSGVPESGIYTLSEGGRGLVVEYQNGIVAATVFAYNETTGAPEWYIASGPLRDDAQEAIRSAPLVNGGYWPIHWFSGDLLRPKNGMCAMCLVPQREPEFDKVGTIEFYVDYMGSPIAFINMPALTDRPYGYHGPKRFNFGHATIPNDRGGGITVDFKGEWVFIDKADPAKPAERYRFGEGRMVDRSREANTRPFSVHTLTYEDPARRATLHCMQSLQSLPSSVEPNPPGSGCELRIEGVARYSMLILDIGLNRIQAFRGPMPLAQGPVLRGPLDIVALRVE